MAEVTDNLQAYWKALESRSRFGLILGALLLMAGVVLLSWWLLKRDYQTLFTGLEERDAASLVAELKRLKIPYAIEGDGTTIKVPAAVVHETRLSLMGKGVNLSGGVGFEIFDNKDLGMTEYTQKINYQRALQGELVRTIMAIDDVKSARVHLVLPEASIFKRDKVRSKASVSLVLKPGGKLTADQILGIQRLVSAAAPGLDPGMVTVLDQRGVALSSAAEGDSAAGLGGGQLRMKQEVERYLTHKAGEVLDRRFGPGQAIVSIDASLNFDEVKRTIQDVVPSRAEGESSGVMVRKRHTQQRQMRADAPAGNYGESRQNAAESGNSSSTLEVDYDVSRRMEQVVMTPGGLRRLSVGVLVPHGLADQQLTQVRALVAMAVGLDERRGDAIAVHSLDQVMSDAAKPGLKPHAGDEAGSDSGSRGVSGEGPAQGFERREIISIVAVLAGGGLLLGILLSQALMRRSRKTVGTGQPAAQADRRKELLAEVKGWLNDGPPLRQAPVAEADKT